MKREVGKLVLIGLATGAVNGLFGAGGGMVLVPLLVGWMRMPQQRAMATSVAIILPLCAVSLIVYVWNDTVQWQVAWPYLVGGAIGGLLSGKLFHKASATWLRRGFGALIIYSGIRAVMLW